MSASFFPCHIPLKKIISRKHWMFPTLSSYIITRERGKSQGKLSDLINVSSSITSHYTVEGWTLQLLFKLSYVTIEIALLSFTKLSSERQYTHTHTHTCLTFAGEGKYIMQPFSARNVIKSLKSRLENIQLQQFWSFPHQQSPVLPYLVPHHSIHKLQIQDLQ